LRFRWTFVRNRVPEHSKSHGRRRAQSTGPPQAIDFSAFGCLSEVWRGLCRLMCRSQTEGQLNTTTANLRRDQNECVGKALDSVGSHVAHDLSIRCMELRGYK
jgi:hypothetical protein